MNGRVKHWSVEIERGDEVSSREISAATARKAENAVAVLLSGTGWRVVPNATVPALTCRVTLFAHAA